MSAGAPGTAAGRVFNIPAPAPFLATLARGIWTEAAGDPLRLSRAIVLLPTRRACRAIGEEFLRLADGRPTLLPRLRPLGDVDEDLVPGDGGADTGDLPPAIGDLRRRLVLARAILAMPDRSAGQGVEHAVELAAELGRLIDQVETERLGFDKLATLVPDRYAEHWRQTLEFLAILTAQWPAILMGEGAIGAARRRNLLLAALSARWAEAGPDVPVYAAGSTGSIPATADLLATIAALPTGRVVLPGLDRLLDEQSWEVLDESHAQYGLAKLLERLGLKRGQVVEWPYLPPIAGPAAARTRLVSETMRPAATTEAWRQMPAIAAEALDGLGRVDCATVQEEATAIALLMRDALETPERTAALVTPDRTLARRVMAELGRYQIAVDDSAGRPLANTPPAVFMRLVAEVAARRTAPVALLGCFKHPLAAGGRSVREFRQLTRRLEIETLRGPRPGDGFAGLRAALPGLRNQRTADSLDAWLQSLESHFAPLTALADGIARPGDLLRAHVRVCETLAATDRERGADRLWAHDDGEALAEFIDDLAGAAADFPALPGGAYPHFFAACMAGRVVRPRYGCHPRLQILGPLEARFVAADLMIVGGLNEGTWPPEPPPDPWMSRPMRKDFGLPGPERRIGLSAHDFAQILGGTNVVMTRAARVDGVPTVPSRWLLRMDAVLAAAGGDAALKPGAPAVVRWSRRVDAGPREPAAPPPAPRPPVAARPRKLSVTAIETWMRDPYAIYARHVLKLRALDPIDADPGAGERGTFIHKALDDFVQLYRDGLPEDAAETLIALGRENFAPILSRPGVRAFWMPRFEAVARWFVAHEAAWRVGARPVLTEADGCLTLNGPAGPFILACKADRIDRLATGGLAIIDYKTGRLPSRTELELGYAPQLPLEAVIALGDGFGPDVKGETVRSLAYWRLTGGNPPGVEYNLDKEIGDPVQLAAAASAGLLKLIARFDRPETAYMARPRPDYAPHFSDYKHLARVKEWSDEAGE